jgi:arylsulfatase A-like enzyme
MTQEIGKRETRISLVTKYVWCIAVLVWTGCQRAPEPVQFHRFVEEVVPGDRWHETKAQIGNETRNVLSAPYRTVPKEIEVAEDGTIALSTVMQIDKISADAVGVTVRAQPPPSRDDPPIEPPATSVYVPFARERDPTSLAETTVQGLPAGAIGRKVRVSAREVLTLPIEHVTQLVTVPRSAQLEFGIGIEGEEATTQPQPVQFSVEVVSAEQRRTIFSQTLDPEQELAEPRWVDATVDLSELAEPDVRFVFKAEASRGDDVVPLHGWSPVWSSPILRFAAAHEMDDKPNLILISLDTLRADHLGCYGYERATSPNIDKFAGEAFLFEHCIAPSSWTLPSHASVFTGLHPSVHGAIVFLPACRPIRQEETTLAELARQHGYVTAAYTEGVLVGGSLGFSQGFELYSDGEATLKGAAEETFNDAFQWVQTHAGLPFFLFVHTYQTHNPYTPPGRFATMFDTDYTGRVGKDIFDPRMDFSDADKIHLEALYDEEIAYTDAVLAEFLAGLEKLRLLEDTIVVIFSDHGEEFWDHGGVQHGVTLYDEQLRVPLIIRLAGNDPPTGRESRQVSLTDLYATITELLGIAHQSPPDCMSLTPLIDVSQPGTRYERTIVVSETCHRDNILQFMNDRWRRYSVRTDGEKYMNTEKYEKEELYNLQADPGETNNIAQDHPSSLERYRAVKESFLESVSAGQPQPPSTELRTVPFSEEDRRRLRALGYL